MVPTYGIICGLSGANEASCGSGRFYSIVLFELEKRKKKKNNYKDALIGSTAAINNFQLITGDSDFAAVMKSVWDKNKIIYWQPQDRITLIEDMFKFRTATNADRKQIFQIVLESNAFPFTRHKFYLDGSNENFDSTYRQSDFLIEKENVVQGWARLNLYEEDSGEIEYLCIRPQLPETLRRRALGEYLLNVIIARATNKPIIQRLTAKVAIKNLSAKNLFEQCGFEVEHDARMGFDLVLKLDGNTDNSKSK